MNQIGTIKLNKSFLNTLGQWVAWDTQNPRCSVSASHITRLLKVMLVSAIIALVIPPSECGGQDATFGTPFFSVGMDNTSGSVEPTVVLQIFLLMTVLSLAPAILVMLTSFTRIVIVLGLLRRALGTNQMPPNQVMIGLALFLTFFIMAPGLAKD